VLNNLQSKPDKTFNPTFKVTVNDNINGSGFTEVIVKINGTDIHQLSKPLGYDTYDNKEEDPTKRRGSKLQSVSKYYIKDANSEILKKFKPNPLVTLLGLYDGKSYKDDSYSDVFGGYITYRRNGDYVDATVTYKYYDDETNSMREQTGKLGSYSLLNTDWEKIMKENKTRLYQIKLDEEALIEQENKITNISYYNKNAK
nr:hypothetical protein [Candidatus Dojkabacteria bacterium]